MGRINRYQLRDSQHSFLFFLFFFFLLYFKFFFLSFLFIEVHQRYTKLCDSLPSADEDKTYGLQTVEDELVSVDSIPGDRPYFLLMLLDVSLSAKCMENTAIITALTKMLLDVFLYIMDVIKENAGCSADMIQNIGDIQPIAIGVDGL